MPETSKISPTRDDFGFMESHLRNKDLEIILNLPPLHL
jgi:hypothetical protein